MAESLYGIELGTLRQAISAHELQGYENLGPYIFTKVSKKKKGESSSGFGPGQITATTAEDMLRRYPSLFQDEEFKTYVNKFITQGNNKLNLDYNNALYKDGRRQRTTKNDRTIFGPLGKGNISEEDHNKYYNKLFDIVIRDKAKKADSLDAFLKNYHGSVSPEKNVDYSSKVQGKLSDLGIDITGTSDPETFAGEPVSPPMPVPTPKPDKPKMPLPEPKPERDQFIDQPGEIEDTGDDVPMRDEKDDNPFEYVPFLRHLPKFMADGGAVPMKEQMDLFQEGGLRDEGGTIDPISGNDVPPGSLQEEVRDDIPAQLSEGEFVFPADVVRYIGLEKLMQMRQEAKQGLAMMERMGQMGNSEEAVMSDEIPFELSDLDISDDMEYNVGGFVPPGVQQQQNFTGITSYTPPQMSQTGLGFVPAAMPPQMQPQMQMPTPTMYTPPQQAAVPMAQTPAQLPQFESFTEKNVENIEYTNSETGEKRTFTFINGQPTVPIPPGFVPSTEYVKPETAKPIAEEVTTQTTRVREDDPSDPPETPGGATIAFGGNIIPGTTNRVENMFKGNLEIGGVGIMDGRAYAMSTFKPGQQNIPDGSFATITNITVPRPEGIYAGTGQRLGNNMRLDSDIFNTYMAGDGKIKVTERQRMARVGQHIKEFYTDKGQSGMTIDVDQRMLNQIDEIDSARKGLRDDPNRNSYSLTHRDEKGNETVVATVSNKVAREVASGVDIEAAAFDYDLPDPPSAYSVDPRTQQDDDPGESGGGTSYSFDGPTSEKAAAGAGSFGPSDAYSGTSGGFSLARAEGGLASKPKPKSKKKMKRGGLASKK